MLGYGLWVLLNVLVALFNIGDGGVNSHLALLFTGFPAALPSLALRHATLPAVALAGVLGLAQWGAVAWLCSAHRHRGTQRDGA